jgi:histidine kinase
MKQQRVKRLALSYLAVIMTLSLVFSVIIYAVTSTQLNRELPPDDHIKQSADIEYQFHHRLERRDNETREMMVISLIALNGVMLAFGYWLSLVLARRTLAPIERSIEQQAQFVSNASHELRTPLAALLLSNEIAMRKRVLTDEKARQVLSQNVEEIKKLTNLSNSLLDLAKSEKEVIRQYSQVAKAKQVKIFHDIPDGQKVTLQVNAARQILSILVDNAIKYAPQKVGEVKIWVRLNKNSVEFIVKDNGPGISSNDQKHIFERFYRADAARTRTDASGYGLGLAIAKTLADRCGYTIRIKSKPSAGAEFILVIPN